MMLFLSILLFVAITIIDAWIESFRIKLGIAIHHNFQAFVIRALFMFLSFSPFMISTGSNDIGYNLLWDIIFSIGIYITGWWLLFDIMLNVFRKEKILYEGKPKVDDSWLDIILRLIPDWLTFPIKLTLLMGFIFLKIFTER